MQPNEKWLSCGLRATVLVIGISVLVVLLNLDNSRRDRFEAADALIHHLLTSPECARTRVFYGNSRGKEITLYTPRNWPRGELKSLAGLAVYRDDDESRDTMLGISIDRFELGQSRRRDWLHQSSDPPIHVVMFNAGRSKGVIGRCFLSLESRKGKTGWEVTLLELFDP